VLSSAYTVRDFAVSHTAFPVRRLGLRKKLGGKKVRTAAPNWPEGYSIPYDVMLNI